MIAQTLVMRLIDERKSNKREPEQRQRVRPTDRQKKKKTENQKRSNMTCNRIA